MAIFLDDITRKKLILVRQLFQRAVIQAEVRHNFVDRIMSLITFDLANETALKAVVSVLDTSVVPKSDFQAIVQQADEKLINAGLPTVPDKARIQHIRTIRNDAQHKAKYPNETDVSDCRTYTRDFLRQLILNVWNENFDSISLIDLIKNEAVKTHLTEAESHLKNGQYGESIGKSSIALDSALSKIENSMVGSFPYYNKAFIVSDGKRAEPDQKTYRAFLKLRNLTVRSLIGLNLSEFTKYSQVVNSVVRVSDGIAIFSSNDYEANEQEAEFVLNYVIDSLIRIENLVGDIDKPFNF